MDEADLIVRNARVTTLHGDSPEAEAFAVRGEKFLAVGTGAETMRLAGDGTRLVDAGGRRVIPGLNDSHLHAIRGGLQYNLELRWDGVDSLRRGLEMIHEQAQRTPQGQWVRVMGGWSPFQFAEKRMPTPPELTEAAPEVPVLVLYAYSQVLVNRAGVAALSLSDGHAPADGGRYEFTGEGLTVRGNTAVYATIGRLPGLASMGRPAQLYPVLLPGAEPVRPDQHRGCRRQRGRLP
jgi:predicted amidohydrolase YtcJ